MTVDSKFHFRHRAVTDTCVDAGYRVCRGPGGPLGAVWGSDGGAGK